MSLPTSTLRPQSARLRRGGSTRSRRERSASAHAEDGNPNKSRRTEKAITSQSLIPRCREDESKERVSMVVMRFPGLAASPATRAQWARSLRRITYFASDGCFCWQLGRCLVRLDAVRPMKRIEARVLANVQNNRDHQCSTSPRRSPSCRRMRSSQRGLGKQIGKAHARTSQSKGIGELRRLNEKDASTPRLYAGRHEPSCRS